MGHDDRRSVCKNRRFEDLPWRNADPELDRLINIIRTFTKQFGNIESSDVDKFRNVIATEIEESRRPSCEPLSV